MTENEPIKTVSDGITFLSTDRYYDGINRWVCHKIKEMDKDAINYAARNMAKLISFHNAVLVPMPGHTGVPTNASKRIRDASIYTSKKISLKFLFLSDIFLFPFIRQQFPVLT